MSPLLISEAESYWLRTALCSLLGGLRLGGGSDLGGSVCAAIDPQCGADFRLDLAGYLRVVDEELFGVVSALPKPSLPIGEERARLLDQLVLDAEVDQASLA